MKVLILTNKKYVEFLSPIVWDANAKHDVHVYFDDAPYPFEQLNNYDIGISFMYLHKVPAKEVNTYTWINFHPAPLPEYKGRNLCYHAIMNGEKTFGATIHYMDESFDTGDIIDVWKFDMDYAWTAEDLSTRTLEESKLMFQHFFPRILRGEELTHIPNIGGRCYKKYPILDSMILKDDEYINRFIRAVTYKQFYPKLSIGGVTYKVVRE